MTEYHALAAKTLQEWQGITDLIARLAGVRVGLIMRVIAAEIEVLVASKTAGNPYHVGAREHLFGSGLYCETVINKQEQLLVANALKSDTWRTNPDLKYGLVSYLGVPIRSPDGSPFGTLCLLDDKENAFSTELQMLMERMRDLIEGHLCLAEENRVQRLFAKESLVRRVLDNIPMAVACTTYEAEYKSLYLNQQFVCLFGYTRDDLPTLDRWFTLAYPDEQYRADRHRDWQGVLEAMQRQPGWVEQSEVAVTCKHGRVLDVLFSAVLVDDLLVVCCVDITERKRREQELAQSRDTIIAVNRELEQQTRSLREATARAQQGSQAKSAFLSTVSHELRAPLHDILGYAQLLTRQVAPGAQHQLAVIQESGQQLLHLINDILDFSRGEAKPILLDPGPLSLSRLTQHLAEIYRLRAARGDNRLITRLATDATDWVLADERRLMQVLRNLLENACKFTQGGQIEFGITQVERPYPAAESAPPDCLIEFSVSDTGVGIPPEHQARLFEPFNRLERDQRMPGLGLGLAIGQQLVRAMGGQITVESDQGERHGSRFSFRLRLPISAPLGAEAGEAPIKGYRGRRRTLLIADDFPTSRRYLADCCAAWGFGVILAEDGEQALAQLRTADSPVDAVLVDQFMPQLDGWGFLRRVRQSQPTADLPVVLISAAPPQRPASFPQDLEFDAYAMKPLSEARLAQMLEEVLSLEWDYAAEPRATEDSPVAPVSPVLPPPGVLSSEQIEAFKRMVTLGQLLALQQWARTMAEQYPQHEPFWQAITHRCSTVDLPGLSRLAEACSDP